MSVISESSTVVPFSYMPDLETLHCPRCGGYHTGLVERKLTEPVTLGGVPFPCWAPCPEPGEPILLQDTLAQIREATAAAAEERDHTARLDCLYDALWRC